MRERQEVVADGEASRLEPRQGLEPLRRGQVEVAAGGGADIAGDALAAPAEVIGRDDVCEHVEPELVAGVQAGVAEPLTLDDHGRLAVRLACFHEAGHLRPVHVATCLRS